MKQQHFILGKESNATVHFISLHRGSLMVGRRTGALAAFDLSERGTPYFIPAYPVFCGLKIKRILKTQHIDYDESTGSRH